MQSNQITNDEIRLSVVMSSIFLQHFVFPEGHMVSFDAHISEVTFEPDVLSPVCG